MKKLIKQSLIIIAWLCLLLGALYWPKINFFSSYGANTINVFTWGDILDPSIIASFEKDTGIKVNLSYYSSNEELLVKLKATKGEGYDLIVPSDYAVSTLIKQNLLKKIDKSKLTFWSAINPNLLGHFFDPSNEYSIPFEWEIFLLGINKNYFNQRDIPLNWGLIFDKNHIDYKISMTNDPIEATLFASLYLFGPKDSLTPAEMSAVRNLLISQKEWVEAYATFRGDYFLATGSCQVALVSSSYLWKTLNQFPSIGFALPKEGTFISIENISIPHPSKKEDLTYQFINYLFQEESALSHFETFGFFPSTLQSLTNIKIAPETKELLLSSEEQFRKFHFAKEVMPQDQITDIWIEVKSGKY